MGFENVGRVWTTKSFYEYVKAELGKPPAWIKAICLHHTAEPSLAQRPSGFSIQHIKNIESFYRNTLNWSTGPHLFVDDNEIFGMCDLRKRGTHAVSFNGSSLGIEVLGFYDKGKESPHSGRGLSCWTTAARGTRVLLDWLGLPLNEDTILFHRDDPETKKSCPGTAVTKDWFLQLVAEVSLSAPVSMHERPAIVAPLADSEIIYRGSAWYAPISRYLAAKGVSAQTVKTNLKRSGKRVTYAGDELEGAFYDKDSETTWAPVREIEEALRKQTA